MMLDPFLDVVAKCRELWERVVTAVCMREKLEKAGTHETE